MKFNIVQYTQHANITYLIHDPVQTILYALEDLGHDVVFQQDQLMTDRYNILVTGVRLDESYVNSIVKSQVPYIVYQTEVFSEYGLNYIDSSMDKNFRIDRQNTYLKLLRNASMVWECFDFNQEFLKTKGIESTIIHHGYQPRLEGYPKKTILFDVCFFGSLTPYRKKILKALYQQNVRVKLLGCNPPLIRDEVLRSSKINLSLRANETTMSHIPHFRILTGLYHNTMSVSENALGQEWLEPMMMCVEPGFDNIVQGIFTALNNDSYEMHAKQFKDHFMAYPMINYMERLIAELP